MAIFNVNSITDNGKGDTPGTLSYAIIQANNQAGILYLISPSYLNREILQCE